jgi:glycosyltransferase involved in cell wall biosynthesis
MKIAQVAPLFEAVPPKFYGGTERVVAYLCDALVKLGHDVTLFAAADAKTKARLIPMRDRAIRLDPTPLKSELAAHLSMLHEITRWATPFDILHFHMDLIHFPMFEIHSEKCVTTLHGRLDMKDLSLAYQHWPSFGLVSVSNRQREPLPGANWLATVSHGIARDQYKPLKNPKEDYFAFVGRASPEKGCDDAIRLAKRAGIPLRIAAKVDNVDRAYFESVIEPMLDDPLIEFIGEIGDDAKSEFMGNARALLFPIKWPEPFGLVMIEAMACGTPVIAYNRGSVPEVITDGVTGFIVSSEDQALQAIQQLGRLDRGAIRESFERRFTSEHMAQAYMEVYSSLIESRNVGPRLLIRCSST